MRMHARAVLLAVALSLIAPTVAQAAPKSVSPGGSVPSQWNLPKPVLPNHPDAAPSSAGGNGDGKNTLSFTNFDDGDMVIALGTLTGHAGEWDESEWNRTKRYDKPCIWSANTTPVNGVLLEKPTKYREYDYAYGCWVPSLSASKRLAARNYCRAQKGEPYVITSSKSDQSRWYCSKLLWASYKYTSGVDIDGNTGLYVWPADIVKDSQVCVFVKAG